MRAIALFSLTLALPAALAGQDARLDRIRQAYPAEVASRIEAILADAEAMNVPVEPLVSKALEGAAKGVPGERVVTALSSYAGRLEEAASLVGGDRDADDVVAAADALKRGVPSQAVRSLAGGSSGDVAIPLVVLGDLIEAGVPVDGAYDVVEDALARRPRAEELLAIPAAVRRLIREGKLPDEAASAVGIAIAQGQLPAAVGGGGPGVGPPSGPPVPPGAGPPGRGAGSRGKPPVKPPGG